MRPCLLEADRERANPRHTCVCASSRGQRDRRHDEPKDKAEKNRKPLHNSLPSLSCPLMQRLSAGLLSFARQRASEQARLDDSFGRGPLRRDCRALCRTTGPRPHGYAEEDESSKRVRSGSPRLGRFASCAAPSELFAACARGRRLHRTTKEAQMALARVVSFDGVDSERIAQMRQEMEQGVRPEEMPAKELLIL